MSAQGGTLGRLGTRQVPIWPVAALLGAAIVAVVGMSILSGNESGVVTSVSDAQRLANSSAAIREQGATLPFPATNPGMWTQAQAEAYADSLITHAVGLENPAAYAPPVTAYVSGLENPGAYLGDGATVSIPKVEGPERVVVNGDVCHQCL
jgi:hypothetical protein